MKRSIPGLTKKGCKARQFILKKILEEENLDSVFISDQKLVHYFTGFWGRNIFSPSFWMDVSGKSILSIPFDSEQEYFADEIIVYPSNRLGTLEDSQIQLSSSMILKNIKEKQKIGYYEIIPGCYSSKYAWFDVSLKLLKMRRKKHEDEVKLLKFAIEACEEVYTHVPKLLKKGYDELELWSELHRVGANYIGETIDELGNDFQIGGLGSKPRPRKCLEGEVYILDLSLVVRGYASDMCRSFLAAGKPNNLQIEAQEKIIELLLDLEGKIKIGVSCHELHQNAQDILHEWKDLKFTHHLGHGIGLSNHESPRINVEWDDCFVEGDVFTLEPGLYGDGLHAGLRIEEVYHLSNNNLLSLTNLPKESF